MITLSILAVWSLVGFFVKTLINNIHKNAKA